MSTNTHRFPLEPLRQQIALRQDAPDVAVSAADVALIVGVTRRTVERWAHAGLTAYQADKAAVALRLHPSALWHDWFDVSLAETARIREEVAA